MNFRVWRYKMLQYDELLKLLDRLSVQPFETQTDIDSLPNIQLNDMQAFFQLLHKYKIGEVFFKYSYVCLEDLEIQDDVITDICSKIHVEKMQLECLNEKIDEYNSKLQCLDYSKPYYLDLFFVYEGFVYSVEETDYWFIDVGFGKPEIALMNIIDENFDLINEVKQRADERIMTGRENLKKRILTDTNFHKCTNRNLRHEYIRNYLTGEEVRRLFWDSDGRLIDGIYLQVFVENIWREYKQS